ncbi:MAG: DNA polymerase III subunit delta [Actinobacteria bacterium]|nr:DNA polymerase III subunit delta [Actinomycetota bacterium]
MSAKISKSTGASIKPVYAIAGETGRLRDAQLAQVREQVLAGADWAMCRRRFDGPQSNIAEVLDELRTLPFLGSRRLVEIHEAEEFVSKYRQTLEEYLASPSNTAVLVLVLEKPLPGNQRLAKLINKIGQCYNLSPAKGQDIPYSLARMAKDRYSKTLQPDTARAMQELVGESLSRLTEELEKLSLYVGDRPTITVEDVEDLVGENRQLSAFEMIDALIKQDTGQAMALLERVLSQDRSAEYTIIGLLAWHIRRLRKAKVLVDQGLSEEQVCRQVKVWYRKREFMQLVRQSTAESLRLACKKLTQADRAIKTGMSNVRNAVEKFIWSLAVQNV